MPKHSIRIRKTGKNPPHTWLEAGTVPVDSGQVMLIDPCYVNPHFANGADDKPGEYPDYAGACKASLTKAGCSNFANGLAFCTSTNIGDGEYPVFVQYDSNGRITRVLIEFAE